MSLPFVRAPHAPELATHYAYCLRLASNHYENFPVVSRLLPKDIRPSVAAIYAFARTADDLADEGDADTETRLTRLAAHANRLEAVATSTPSQDPVFIALADTVAKHSLPLQPFRDLLDAFRLDIVQRRYADFDQVLGYCRYSANPIGRLLLHLLEAATPMNIELSDQLCTGLQLTNMLQDLDQDYAENERIYLPRDEMVACGVTERHFRERISDGAMYRLVEEQIGRADRLLRHGLHLSHRLGGSTGLHVRLITHGGLRVLERVQAHRHDLFARPRLRRRDWIVIVGRALSPRSLFAVRR